jgi:transcription initiation factor TFIIIB Brf1 subunit/transcription initiation factor TFIIB
MRTQWADCLTPEHFKLENLFQIKRWMCNNCGLIFDYQFEFEYPGWPNFDFHKPEQGESCTRCGISFDKQPLVPISVDRSSDEDSAERTLTEKRHQRRLYQKLLECFNEEELKTLCFKLGVEYDDLPATGRENKARELVKYLSRCDRIRDLVKICKELHPTASWD